MADRKINIRSPFYQKTSADPAFGRTMISSELELFIYTGTLYTDTPATAQYTITKKPLSGNNYVVYEISELVRDYLDIAFDGDYDSQTIWVEGYISNTMDTATETDSFVYIAYDGYGYHEDGINPELTKPYLQSNNIIYRLDDHNVRIPIDTRVAESAVFLLNGEIVRSETFTSTENTSTQVKYFNVGNSDADTYTQRVLLDSGDIELTNCLKDFFGAEDIGEADEVRVTQRTNNFLGWLGNTETIKIVKEPCSKYTPYKAVFVNKFGALQDLYFSRKSVESISTTGETYKSNLVDFDTLTYDTSRHQVSQYNKLGKESITLNTGFLSEEYNEVIKQLMLSEQVWIIASNSGDVYPVIPKTQSVTYKTSINDRLVQYTIDFDYAFDKINTVR